MIIRFTCVFALFSVVRLVAQTDPASQAGEALEKRDYRRAVSLVAQAEQQLGASPRLESIRAMAWHEAGDAVEAFKSLERYAELTRGVPGLETNSSHRELHELLEQYRARLEKERKEKQEKLQRERDAEAAKIEAAAREAARRKRDALIQRLDRKLAGLPPGRLAELTGADVTELKAAGQTAFAARFDERVFRIAKLDTGAFRLGMTREDFETVIYRRLRQAGSDEPVLRQAIEAMRLPRTREVFLGVAIPVTSAGLPDLVSSGGPLVSAAWAVPGFRIQQHQQPLMKLLQVVGDVGLASPEAQGKMFLAAVQFDDNDQAVELIFTSPFEPGVPVGAVASALAEKFGRMQPLPGAENGLLRFDSARDHLKGGMFAYPAVAGRRLTGRIVQSLEPGLETPVVLELRLKRLTEDDDLSRVPPIDTIGLRPGERLTYLRRLAELELNGNQQWAHGRIWEGEHGRRRVLIEPDAFRLDGEVGEQRFTLVDEAGVAQRVTYRDIRFDTLVDLSKGTPQAAAANTAIARFSRPVLRQVGDGELELVDTVPFFSGLNDVQSDSYTLDAVKVAAVVALPPVEALSAQQLDRVLSWLFIGRLPKLFAELVRTAEAQRKPIDPVKAAHVYSFAGDEAAQVRCLRQAAEAGRADAMAALVAAYTLRSQSEKPPFEVSEARRWAERGAALGNTTCMQWLIDDAADSDWVVADHWAKLMQAKGSPYRGKVDMERLARRADRVRPYRGMSHDQKLRAFVPDVPGHGLGERFKVYAKGRQFTKKSEYQGPTSRKKVTIYQMAQVKRGEPAFLWVNRHGVIIGGHYLLGGNEAYADARQELRQIFGEDYLAIPSYDHDRPQRATGVRRNEVRTIELLGFAKETWLQVVDHTRE